MKFSRCAQDWTQSIGRGLHPSFFSLTLLYSCTAGWRGRDYSTTHIKHLLLQVHSSPKAGNLSYLSSNLKFVLKKINTWLHTYKINNIHTFGKKGFPRVSEDLFDIHPWHGWFGWHKAVFVACNRTMAHPCIDLWSYRLEDLQASIHYTQ